MSSRRRRGTAFDADAVVVGAGVVGASLAAALAARLDWHVIVVERQSAPGVTTGYDSRTLAITAASQRFLELAGVWSALDPARLGWFRRMEVWEPGAGRIVFDSAEIGAPGLGVIVENRILLAALGAATQRDARIALRTGRLVTGFVAAADHVRLTLDDDTALTTRILVGADGVASCIRTLAAIEFTQHAYDQSALTAVVRTSAPHAETARQIFLPSGPLAFLPLGDPHLCAIVWSTAPAAAATLAAMPEAGFLRELGAAFEHALGPITWCGPRDCFALSHGRAARYVGPRLALIGDAAHVVHPLAGQGANLGLMDAAALIECLETALGAERDPGAERTLRRYERWRKGENLMMQAALHGLRSLFAAQAAPVRQARTTGLALVNAALPLKRLIMRRASGYSGDLPALLRAAIN